MLKPVIMSVDDEPVVLKAVDRKDLSGLISLTGLIKCGEFNNSHIDTHNATHLRV